MFGGGHLFQSCMKLFILMSAEIRLSQRIKLESITFIISHVLIDMIIISPNKLGELGQRPSGKERGVTRSRALNFFVCLFSLYFVHLITPQHFLDI